jgi:hypothetical protein
MDLITVVIIGLVIYSIIKKVKKKIQPDSPVSEREIFTGRDSLTLLREIIKQTKEFQDPKQVLELKQKISYAKRLENMSAEGEAGVERLWAEAADLGVEGISGSEGTQGIEGTLGSEGTQGIEGTSGIEGTQGIEGTSGYEGNWGIKGTPGQGVQALASTPRREAVYGFLNPDFRLNEQEILQGIIWAEVLGRPRALRPNSNYQSVVGQRP